MVDDTEEARANLDLYPRPLNVIEGPLMQVQLNILVFGRVMGTSIAN